VITLRSNTAARLGIAAASLVVLLIAIAFSKRKTEAMDSDLPPQEVSALDQAATAAVSAAHD
jgi:hypothetical protein